MDQPARRRAHAHDGLDAIAPLAADLPEIGGARFALAGLRSSRDGATLHVMASGWEPQGQGWLVHGTGPASSPLDLSLSWRARDSTGRWHLVSGMSWGAASQTRGMIKMYLTPPLHPAATALDVIVTGPASRVRATVPLGWTPARRAPRRAARAPGGPHRARTGGRPAGGLLTHRPPGPVTPPWWAAFPRPRPGSGAAPGSTCCAGPTGGCSATGHADAEGELVLAALGGDQAECVAMLEAWGAHADDLDVLALGPRSPADELAVTWELVDELRAVSGPAARIRRR